MLESIAPQALNYMLVLLVKISKFPRLMVSQKVGIRGIFHQKGGSHSTQIFERFLCDFFCRFCCEIASFITVPYYTTNHNPCGNYQLSSCIYSKEHRFSLAVLKKNKKLNKNPVGLIQPIPALGLYIPT